MKTYTLSNDFHGTKTKVRCEGLSYWNEVVIKLSQSQVKKCARTLCGIKECTCGRIARTRGVQFTDDNKRIIIEVAE